MHPWGGELSASGVGETPSRLQADYVVAQATSAGTAPKETDAEMPKQVARTLSLNASALALGVEAPLSVWGQFKAFLLEHNTSEAKMRTPPYARSSCCCWFHTRTSLGYSRSLHHLRPAPALDFGSCCCRHRQRRRSTRRRSRMVRVLRCLVSVRHRAQALSWELGRDDNRLQRAQPRALFSSPAVGLFLSNFINFFILAICVFIAVKLILSRWVPPKRRCPFCWQKILKCASRCNECAMEIPPVSTLFSSTHTSRYQQTTGRRREVLQ